MLNKIGKLKKKIPWIVLLFMLFPYNCALGQISLVIDSIDLSRDYTLVSPIGDLGLRWEFGPCEGYGPFVCFSPSVGFVLRDGFTPRIKMSATFRNNTDTAIYVSRYGFRSDPPISCMQFTYGDKTYSKALLWLNPESDSLAITYGMWIEPHESKRMSFWTFLPSEPPSDLPDVITPYYKTFPEKWNWNGANVAPDSVYLQWMERVLPTIKLKILYFIQPSNKNREVGEITFGKDGEYIRGVASRPVDLKKIAFTHGLTLEEENPH